jgi:hypothetical protein
MPRDPKKETLTRKFRAESAQFREKFDMILTGLKSLEKTLENAIKDYHDSLADSADLKDDVTTELDKLKTWADTQSREIWDKHQKARDTLEP